MIRFFFEALIIYICVKLLLAIHVFTMGELKEFGLFCFSLSLLFVLSRYALVLRDKLYPTAK